MFNCGGCDKCKMRRCSNKLALCNVLPANDCNMIVEHVNDCCRCEWMKEQEQHYNVYHRNMIIN